jgi:hypothetical protein
MRRVDELQSCELLDALDLLSLFKFRENFRDAEKQRRVDAFDLAPKVRCE